MSVLSSFFFAARLKVVPGQGNGKCEDGRSSSHQGMKEGVLCDLGTDCQDCGPFHWRVPVRHPDLPYLLRPRPIQQLRKRGIPVYARITETVPAFWMPYTNPDHDVDVSGQVHHNGAVETGNTQIVHHHLQVSLTAKFRTLAHMLCKVLGTIL